MKNPPPPPPVPPLDRVIVEGVSTFCDNCGSTMSKKYGFFGPRSCDNMKCPNSDYGRGNIRDERDEVLWP